MAEINVSKEFFVEASKCKSVDELLALAKDKGVELSKDVAEKFMAQISESELSIDKIDEVAGGQFCVGAVSIPCVVVGV